MQAVRLKGRSPANESFNDRPWPSEMVGVSLRVSANSSSALYMPLRSKSISVMSTNPCRASFSKSMSKHLPAPKMQIDERAGCFAFVCRTSCSRRSRWLAQNRFANWAGRLDVPTVPPMAAALFPNSRANSCDSAAATSPSPSSGCSFPRKSEKDDNSEVLCVLGRGASR